MAWRFSSVCEMIASIFTSYEFWSLVFARSLFWHSLEAIHYGIINITWYQTSMMIYIYGFDGALYLVQVHTCLEEPSWRGLVGRSYDVFGGV